MVARVSGVVCLTDNLQMPRGQRVRVAPRGQPRRAQWTVMDRVSWCWCGQRLFADPGDEWSAWLAQPERRPLDTKVATPQGETPDSTNYKYI
jgi:hypothetical protein